MNAGSRMLPPTSPTASSVGSAPLATVGDAPSCGGCSTLACDGEFSRHAARARRSALGRFGSSKCWKSTPPPPPPPPPLRAPRVACGVLLGCGTATPDMCGVVARRGSRTGGSGDAPREVPTCPLSRPWSEGGGWWTEPCGGCAAETVAPVLVGSRTRVASRWCLCRGLGAPPPAPGTMPAPSLSLPAREHSRRRKAKRVRRAGRVVRLASAGGCATTARRRKRLACIIATEWTRHAKDGYEGAPERRAKTARWAQMQCCKEQHTLAATDSGTQLLGTRRC